MNAQRNFVRFSSSSAPTDEEVLRKLRSAGAQLRVLDVPDATQLTHQVVRELASCSSLQELCLGAEDPQYPGVISGRELCDHLPATITQLDITGCNMLCGDLVELRTKLSALDEDTLVHGCEECVDHPAEGVVGSMPRRAIPAGYTEDQREEFRMASCRMCSNETCANAACDECAGGCVCEVCGNILCRECNPGTELGWFECSDGKYAGCGKTCCGECVGRPGRYENNYFGICVSCVEKDKSGEDDGFSW